MEKFRVLSDLHMDINEKYPFSLNNSDVFTVIAGDTSGLPFIINAKCDNPHVGLKVESSIKIAERKAASHAAQKIPPKLMKLKL